MTITSCLGWNYKFGTFFLENILIFSMGFYCQLYLQAYHCIFSNNCPFDVEIQYYAHKSEEERITSKMIFYAETQFSLYCWAI